jgi:hypothetical protein
MLTFSSCHQLFLDGAFRDLDLETGFFFDTPAEDDLELRLAACFENAAACLSLIPFFLNLL